MSSIKNIISTYIKNINIPCVIIFLIHLYMTFFTDSIIFTGEYSKKFLYIIIKALAIIALFFFWQGIYKLYRGLKEKNEHIQRYIINFCIYFIPMMIFLFLTWPGVWRSDEVYILNTVTTLQLNYWHHWLTDVYYIFSLCIIGFPVGIVIIQLFIISAIVSVIVTTVYEKINRKYAWGIFIPLFFPTVISNNLYPLRLPIYSFIELLFAFLIVNFYIRKKIIKIYESIILGGLIAILSTWRAEGIYYIIVAPIIIIIILKQQVNLKSMTTIIVLSVGLCGMINYIQNVNPKAITYSISGISSQLGAILRSDFKSNSKEEDLNTINKVFPVDEFIKSEDDASGFILNYLLNNNVEQNDKDFEKNVKQLKKVYVKLVLYNLPTYLKESGKNFLITSGFRNNINTSVADTSAVFDEGYAYGTLKNNPYGSYYLIQPISVKARAIVIKFLECRSFNNYYQTTPLFHFFYNVVPSVLILIYVAVIGFIRKNKVYFLISLMILIKAGLIFATAPAIFFMYYLPTYICGYVLGIIFLISKDKILIK